MPITVDCLACLTENLLPEILEVHREGQQPAQEPASPWGDISDMPITDDLVWLFKGDTYEGPRKPRYDDIDYWEFWCPCEPPPFGAVDEGLVKPSSRGQAEEEFKQKRLRRLINLLEMQSQVPSDDKELLACLGSVLGMVCRKIEAQQPAQAAVPEGWKLVPIKPTAQMLEASDDYEITFSYGYGDETDEMTGNICQDDARAIYQKMLNAAPDSGEGL